MKGIPKHSWEIDQALESARSETRRGELARALAERDAKNCRTFALQPQSMYTREEAAELLGVSPEQITRGRLMRRELEVEMVGMHGDELEGPKREGRSRGIRALYLEPVSFYTAAEIQTLLCVFAAELDDLLVGYQEPITHEEALHLVDKCCSDAEIEDALGEEAGHALPDERRSEFLDVRVRVPAYIAERWRATAEEKGTSLDELASGVFIEIQTRPQSQAKESLTKESLIMAYRIACGLPTGPVAAG